MQKQRPGVVSKPTKKLNFYFRNIKKEADQIDTAS